MTKHDRIFWATMLAGTVVGLLAFLLIPWHIDCGYEGKLVSCDDERLRAVLEARKQGRRDRVITGIAIDPVLPSKQQGPLKGFNQGDTDLDYVPGSSPVRMRPVTR